MVTTTDEHAVQKCYKWLFSDVFSDERTEKDSAGFMDK